MRKFNFFLKRLFDVLLSGLGLLVMSPIFLLVVILIKITMPGPIFFHQTRVGRNGKLFDILKFRSMKVDKEAEEHFDFSKDEERITWFGKFLRRSKLDEMPQLLNVFKGDMSLVGPRPTIKEQVDEYTERQRGRLRVRPGMTGLAQINGNTALSWDERIAYDLEYVDRFSVLLDIRILMKTVLVVIFGEEKFTSRKGDVNS